MKINSKGLELIKHFEGLRLKTYICAGGVLTIGWGHTGKDVMPGMVITEDRANELLRADLERFEQGVSKYVTAKLNDNQFSALVCFTFNIGLGAFASSTLLKLLNAEDYAGVADQFLRWNKAGEKVLLGLTKRREAERQLYLLEDVA